MEHKLKVGRGGANRLPLFKYFRSPVQRSGIRKTYLLTIIWFGFMVYIGNGLGHHDQPAVYPLSHYRRDFQRPSQLITP